MQIYVNFDTTYCFFYVFVVIKTTIITFVALFIKPLKII